MKPRSLGSEDAGIHKGTEQVARSALSQASNTVHAGEGSGPRASAAVKGGRRRPLLLDIAPDYSASLPPVGRGELSAPAVQDL